MTTPRPILQPASVNSHQQPSRLLLLLGKLAEHTEGIISAIVAGDREQLEWHTREQQSACILLRAFTGSTAPAPDSEDRPPQPSTGAAMAHARQRSRICSALLRRAQRTNRIFLRLLAASALTYSVPPQAPTGIGR